MQKWKAFLLGMTVTPLAVVGLTLAFAGEVTIPHTFVSNTPAVAAEVNANFAAVKAEIDDNDARIEALHSGAPLRLMRGVLLPDGGIGEGQGFTVTHTLGTGFYRVDYDVSFPHAACVSVQPLALTRGVATLEIIGPGFFEFTITNSAGVPTDSHSSFIAVGPQ